MNNKGGSLASIFAFLMGLPLGIGTLWAIGQGYGTRWFNQYADLQRYTSHPVEKAEVLLFFCALTALVGKFISFLRERSALEQGLLPKWDKKSIPPGESASLINSFNQTAGMWRSTYLGRRIFNVLDFVKSRNSANDLDDQLRTLSDNDVVSQDGSYSMLRFINWSIPILGFLGTVLGITEAISGVTPEVLEKNLNAVTDGLVLAFDTTALALFLVMILMFFNFLVERMEQGLLEQVDGFVDEYLAHRFQRSVVTGPGNSGVPILELTETLVERQAQVWSNSINLAEVRWSQEGERQRDLLTHGIKMGLDAALKENARLMGQFGESFLTHCKVVVEKMDQLTQSLAVQTEKLGQVQENEKVLLQLQETLNQNLAAIHNTGTFEEAVQSLTGAIHLLTARVSTNNSTPHLRISKPG